ncbi:uncharacterized protein UTRI_04638_B [Ustilago trichophora]|uniref:2-oxoadipate dioxygenase/decarboxylase n=1 Tax=Ustilago trichophora TaxID=86804 RepID=A0A5C3EGC5_9BASI|nr:uncharacterized protein UTRI_04638_B [Ustilago trichophora]
MYGTSNRYTFISPAAFQDPQQQHHQALVQQHHPPPRRNSDRCDVHHSVAQLYLRTLPNLQALPLRSNSDPPTIKKETRRKRSSSKTKRSSRTMEMTSEVVPGSTRATSMDVAGVKSPTVSSFNPSGSFILSQQEVFPALSCTDESEVSSASSTASSVREGGSLTSTQLRAFLASSMSSMYRTEVPLYGDLLSIISTVNSSVIRSNPDIINDDEISRLNVERHGAIRVGTTQELSLLSRIFRIFGMHPVGYYDLAKDAGLPIHATAFRPVGRQNLLKNPFRIFCSLLRMDLIRDLPTRQLAEELVGKRKIVSDRCVQLLVKAESALPEEIADVEVKITGLSRREALEFVESVVDIFAWHPDTPVSMGHYKLLAKSHALVADIVSFRGPHINHLTPRTLDIDQVQRTMVLQGIDAKDVVEGPPARANPVYLRQTSFHALSEEVKFLGGGEDGVEQGKHKARFGEIEARGQALTKKGSRLYDALMAKVADVKRAEEGKRGGKGVGKEECVQILDEVFREGFPDEKDALLRGGLGFFMFSVRDQGVAKQMVMESGVNSGCELLADMVQAGALDAEPITYEDFLPASAAGIFQSNLPQTATATAPSSSASTSTKGNEQQEPNVKMDDEEARGKLEAAVGGQILDYFTLYAEQQRQSLTEVSAAIGVELLALADTVERQGAA